MRTNRLWLKRTVTLGLLLMTGMTLNACAGSFGLGGTSWKEEVLLHNGSKIIATRTVERGGRHEIGQEPPIKNQNLSFTVPGTDNPVTWEDRHSDDIGGASFNLKLLDIVSGTPYVLAMPAGCLSYNKWGRPNPPYVIFKFSGNEWQRITLQELPIVIKTPNLIPSDPDHEAKKAGGSVVKAEIIRALYDDYRQPEYKSILREPVKNAAGRCGEMVYDGKGGWTGIGWFRKQPNREACFKYCERQDIPAQYCPCETIFGGK